MPLSSTEQNIALLGHEKEKSNFYQLATLRALDDEDLVNWMDKKRGNYMHSDCQAELLQIMGRRLLREHILKPIYQGFFIKMSEMINVF